MTIAVLLSFSWKMLKNQRTNLCKKIEMILINSLIEILFVVFDAMGKPGSGLLTYNFRFVGSWEECLSVQATAYTNISGVLEENHPFNGKYCITTFTFGQMVSFSNYLK